MNELENLECAAFCKQYRLHFEDANFAKGYIPRKILLDSTRNIHSYFVFCKYEDGGISSAYWQKDNLKASVKSMLSLQYSDLDRPLFIVIHDESNRYKTIEGNEIREALLECPSLDMTQYILNNSYDFFDLLVQIRKEL